jgi:hypothetical protein
VRKEDGIDVTVGTDKVLIHAPFLYIISKTRVLKQNAQMNVVGLKYCRTKFVPVWVV